MGLTNILTLLCIALFALLGAYLINSRRKRSKSNKLLGIFFLLWSLNFLDGLLFLNGFYLRFPNLALWEDSLVFLYGPVIYFYCRWLIGIEPHWKPAFLLHTIPMIGLFIITIFIYHLQPASTKLEIIGALLNLEQPPGVLFFTIVALAHILAYIYASWRLVNRYHRDLMNNFSTINLSWLHNTLRSLAVFVLLSFAVSILQYHGNQLLFEIGLMILMASLVIFISSVLFKALEEPQLFLSNVSEKYTHSNLSKQQKQEIAHQIRQTLDHSRIYLKPETTLSDLADLIGCTPRNASQVINEVFNVNFFELINDYRVKAAQKIIEQSNDPKLTILEVMYQVGFNSKSSFNTQFKKIAGITPSEFRKLHQ